jgi:hypothetical protein
MAKFRMFSGLALLLVAMSAFGQEMRTIRANVPFSFQAAGKTWAAGEYRVRFDSRLNAITLTSFGVNTATAFTTKVTDPGLVTRTYLRFHRYGDTWLLQEVSFDGTVQALNLGKSEREIVRADVTNSHESREIVSDSEALAQSNFVKNQP